MRLGSTTGWMAAATAAGVIATFVALFAMGAGHGTNVPGYFLLPWTMLLLSARAGNALLMIVSLAQFPLYAALVIGNRWLVVPIVIGHAAATAGLMMRDGYLF